MRKTNCIFVSTLRLVLAEDLWLPGALPQYANQELRNRWEGKQHFHTERDTSPHWIQFGQDPGLAVHPLAGYSYDRMIQV